MTFTYYGYFIYYLFFTFIKTRIILVIYIFLTHYFTQKILRGVWGLLMGVMVIIYS